MTSNTIVQRTYSVRGIVGMTVFVCLLTFGIRSVLYALQLSHLSVEAVWQALLLSAVWLFATHDGLGVRSLNPGKSWNRRDGLLMVAFVLISSVVSGTYAYLLRSSLPKENPWLETLIRNFKELDPVTFGVVAIGLALLIGFAEELAFRSYLITRLRNCGLPAWSSILVSAAAFGFIHWPDYGLLLAVEKGVTWGIPAGYFFYRRGSILPLVAAHFFVNALSFTCAYLVPLGPSDHQFSML